MLAFAFVLHVIMCQDLLCCSIMSIYSVSPILQLFSPTPLKFLRKQQTMNHADRNKN